MSEQEISDQEARDCLTKIDQLGITQQTVANSLGVHRSTINRWASGKFTLKRKARAKLKKFIQDYIPPTITKNDDYNRTKRILNEDDIVFLQKISKELEPITLKLAFRLLALRKVKAKTD